MTGGEGGRDDEVRGPIIRSLAQCGTFCRLHLLGDERSDVWIDDERVSKD